MSSDESLQIEVDARRRAVEASRLPLAGNDVRALYGAAREALRRAPGESVLAAGRMREGRSDY